MDGRSASAALAVVLTLVLTACSSSSLTPPGEPAAAAETAETAEAPARAVDESWQITIAFAGDTHFELHLARLLDRPREALGPISRTLRRADLAMLNLESAVTERGTRDPKELEDADNRFHFRTPARALDALAASGIDVVSLANNHVGDYGAIGMADTLAAARRGPLAVVGIGRNEAEAFTPHRVRIKGLDVAVLAADTVFREGNSGVWAAGPDNPGAAAARRSRPVALLDGVRASAASDDLTVVYLHWGREQQSCPTQRQRTLSRALSDAGADVVVGTHSHVLGGTGWSDETYVGYGLGNFVWYHDRQPDTGVLTLALDEDGVVSEDWTPARIAEGGRPLPVTGAERDRAVDDWRNLARCTGLADTRGGEQAVDPAYESSVSRIDADLAERMSTSHSAGCPVPLRDLRYLRMTHRDFDGVAQTGEMVVHRRHAANVVQVFERLYDQGFPIRRMRLVDDYGGDDDRSMAANNTSGFNCRRVAGQAGWSDHAYGSAIDINPIQNPYLRLGSVEPPSGRAFAGLDRGTSAPVAAGVVRNADPVVEAFERIGWEWGGYWTSSKDYQHFAAPDAR